ncbi:MAG TPA: undecaprenyl-diphosphate phosphatase [Candidatus Syntrophosphaera sp.]|jgi:undecaprenyl-diphosphatase|nr:undecaprenyl-diphosphate phosphatase [Candidatus Syntrophosphaera sp.]
MNFISSILLGILQGLTEFLPVSSSGHLVLAQHFFGLEDTGDVLFEVFLHLGTLLAVLVFFRRRIGELVVSLFSWRGTVSNQAHRHNRNLLLYLAVATLVTGVVFVLLGDLFESLFAKPLIVACMLLVTGIIVYTSDLMKGGATPASEMGLVRSCAIGLIQGVAIIPGISRSGSTIAGALYTGVKRQEAAEFSFLLSIPAILAANLANFGEFKALGASQLGIYLAGFVAAFVAGYLVISFLIKLIVRARLKYFAYYCWAVGLVSIVFILLGR